jgi:zinc protease
MQQAGVFYAFVAVRPGAKVERVEAMLFEEIGRVAREGVSADELEKAKRQLEVGLVNGLATSHALANRIGYDFLTLGRIRPLEERLAAIAAVRAEDVRRVAQTYLGADRRSIVRVVPPPPKEKQR